MEGATLTVLAIVILIAIKLDSVSKCLLRIEKILNGVKIEDEIEP